MLVYRYIVYNNFGEDPKVKSEEQKRKQNVSLYTRNIFKLVNILIFLVAVQYAI
jgi:hypothetical protein